MDYAYPNEMNEDYGEPLTTDCEEIGMSEVFTRSWTNANVSLNCTDLSATIQMKDGRVLSSQDSPDEPAERNSLHGGGYGGRGNTIPV